MKIAFIIIASSLLLSAPALAHPVGPPGWGGGWHHGWHGGWHHGLGHGWRGGWGSGYYTPVCYDYYGRPVACEVEEPY